MYGPKSSKCLQVELQAGWVKTPHHLSWNSQVCVASCVCLSPVMFPPDVEITTARRLCTRVQRKRKREHFLEGPIKYLLWFYWLEMGYIYIPEPIIISQKKRFMFVSLDLSQMHPWKSSSL